MMIRAVCQQVLDKNVRDTLPNLVRYFTTLIQHECFKSTIGIVRMAIAPYAHANASSGGQGSSSNKEAGSGKPKEGKKAKEAKPKKAPKVAKPGGDAAGEEYVVHEYPLTYLLS